MKEYGKKEYKKESGEGENGGIKEENEDEMDEKRNMSAGQECFHYT